MPQETNMAEVLRLLRNLIVKTDGLVLDMNEVKTDVQVLKSNVQVLETRFDRLDEKVDHLTGRFEDVAGVVIKDTHRIQSREHRVDILEGKAN